MKAITSAILLFVAYVSAGLGHTQVSDSITSRLPKAEVSTYETFHRGTWSPISVVSVNFSGFDEDHGAYFESNAIINAEIKDLPTYLLMVDGGSETDIDIYTIDGYNYERGYFEIGTSKVRSQVFFWGDDETKKLIRIDDLTQGYYYVMYVSCNVSGSLVLKIE